MAHFVCMRSRSFIPCMKISSATRYLEAKFEVSETYDLWPIDQSSPTHYNLMETKHWQKSKAISAIKLFFSQNEESTETISQVQCQWPWADFQGHRDHFFSQHWASAQLRYCLPVLSGICSSGRPPVNQGTNLNGLSYHFHILQVDPSGEYPQTIFSFSKYHFPTFPNFFIDQSSILHVLQRGIVWAIFQWFHMMGIILVW